MRICVVVVGAEIVSGRVADTNGRFIASELERAGLRPSLWLVVGDEPEHLAAALRYGAEHADALVVSGGLGPTVDDRTIEVAAAVAECGLVSDCGVVDKLTALYRRRGREPQATDLKQALLPAGARALGNPIGTAPGVCVPDLCGVASYFVPGVPAECELMVRSIVVPELKALFAPAGERLNHVFCCTGISESKLAHLVAGICSERDDVETQYGVGSGRIELTLVLLQPSKEGAFEALVQRVREALGQLCYGDGRRCSLAEAVIELLVEHRVQVALAESCTGGLATHLLTQVSGASEVVMGGVVAYDNEVKRSLLGVNEHILTEHGAVSPECAGAMAVGVVKAIGADIGVAITGLAGPGGGTPSKPVGTAYLALADGSGLVAQHALKLVGSRTMIQSRCAAAALNALRKAVLQRSSTGAARRFG